MSETPAPYTGSSDPALSGPPQPAHPTYATPRTVVWRNPWLLIATGAVALAGAILTTVGGQGFPYNAPVEQIYAFGLTVDLVAVLVVMIIFTVLEFRRRADRDRRAQPANTGRSVQAIVGVILTGVALVAWLIGGGLAELIGLIAGDRGRYMNATGALFLVGGAWTVGIIFGALGFRPNGHRTSNILALVAVGVGLLLIVPTTIAALVYGQGLSD